MAVKSFLLIGDVRSMNLERASLTVIESPVGKGVLGVLPLKAGFLVKQKDMLRSRPNYFANCSTSAVLLVA